MEREWQQGRWAKDGGGFTLGRISYRNCLGREKGEGRKRRKRKRKRKRKRNLFLPRREKEGTDTK